MKSTHAQDNAVCMCVHEYQNQKRWAFLYLHVRTVSHNYAISKMHLRVQHFEDNATAGYASVVNLACACLGSFRGRGSFHTCSYASCSAAPLSSHGSLAKPENRNHDVSKLADQRHGQAVALQPNALDP